MATLDPVAVLDSLRRADARALAQVRRVLVRAAAAAETVRSVARRLRRYLSPWASPRRDATGALLRAGRAVPGSWPGQPGAASAHDRMLIETLASEAHGEAVVRAAAARRRGVRWLLSPGHVEADECDEKARRDVGHGRGVYPPGSVPEYPSHPRCRCVLETVPLGSAEGERA